MLIASLPIGDLVQFVLWALGLSYIITGSKIGYPLRWLWCAITSKIHNPVISPWSLVQCAPCCSFWMGVGLSCVAGFDPWTTLEVACVSCGVTAVVHKSLIGGLSADEDFEQAFGMKAKEQQ